MSETEVGAIVYRFKADTSGLKAGFAEAQTQMRNMGAAAAEVGKKAGDAAKQAGAEASKAAGAVARSAAAVRAPEDAEAAGNDNNFSEISSGAERAAAAVHKLTDRLQDLNAEAGKLRGLSFGEALSAPALDQVTSRVHALTQAFGGLPKAVADARAQMSGLAHDVPSPNSTSAEAAKVSPAQKARKEQAAPATETAKVAAPAATAPAQIEALDKFNSGLDRVRQFSWNNTAFSAGETSKVEARITGLSRATDALSHATAKTQTQLRDMSTAAADAGKKAGDAARTAGAAAAQAGESVKRATQGLSSASGGIGTAAVENPFKAVSTGADEAAAGVKRAGISVESFNAGLDRVREFAWNNTGFSGDEIDRVINPVQGLAGALGVLPTIAVAAAAAVAGALALLALRAHEAHVAAQQLADDLSLSGQVNAFGGATEAAGRLVDQLTRISSAWDIAGKGAALSTEEARKFGAEVANLPAATEEMAAGFGDLARAQRYAFGSEGVDMVQGLAAALRAPEQALQTLIASNLHLTGAQRQAAQGALDSGNAQRQASTYFQIVTDDFTRQKAEAILLDAAHNSLSSATRELAAEALAAARSSGDFEGALQRLALAGSDAAHRLLGAVGAIRSIRAEMARGLGGVELSNALQAANDKLYPLHTAARAATAQLEDATRTVKDLEARIGAATANLNRMKVAGEEGSKEFQSGAADVARLNEQLATARANAAAFGAAAQKANEALEGGSSYSRAKKSIDAAHDVDKDEIARHRETIAALEAQRADLVNSEVAKTEDGTARIREINESLRDEEAKLAAERLGVQVARIDAEIAKEEQGTERKKQLARQKFEAETKWLSPDSKEYVEKQSTLQSVLDEEPRDASAGRGRSSNAAATRQSAIDRYVDSLKLAEASAQAEAENWNAGNVERAKAIALAKANETAEKEGVQLTAERRAQVEALAGATQRYKDRVEELKQKQQEANAAAREFANTVAGAFDNLIVQGKSLRSTLADISKSLSGSALRGALTGEGMFGQALGLGGQKGAPGGLLGLAFGGFSGIFGKIQETAGGAPAGPQQAAPAAGGLLSGLSGILGGKAGAATGSDVTVSANVVTVRGAGGALGAEGIEAAAGGDAQSGPFGKLTSGLESMFSKLSDLFNGLAGKLGDLFSGLANSLSGIFSSLTSSLGGLLSGGGGGVASGIGGLFSGIGSLFGFAAGGVMTGHGPVPARRYAEGGVATSPQLALFGEAGVPEAYVPMPDPRGVRVVFDRAGADGAPRAHIALPGGRGIPTILDGFGKAAPIGPQSALREPVYSTVPAAVARPAPLVTSGIGPAVAPSGVASALDSEEPRAHPTRSDASSAPAVHAFADSGIMTDGGPQPAPRSPRPPRADARRFVPSRIAPLAAAVRPTARAPLASPALGAPPVFAPGVTAAAQAPAPVLTAPAAADAAPRGHGSATTGSPTPSLKTAPALSLALTLAPLAAAAAPVQAPEAPRIAAQFAPTSITNPVVGGPRGPQAVAGPALRPNVGVPARSLAINLAPLAATAAEPSSTSIPAPAPKAHRSAQLFPTVPKISAPVIVGGPQAVAGPARVAPLPNFAGFFADGGVIPSGKWGIAGERGPEAIVNAGAAGDFSAPARNGASTTRGEASQGGAQGNVFNFHFPPGTDARSFQQSEGQISAMLVRAAARGRRNT